MYHYGNLIWIIRRLKLLANGQLYVQANITSIAPHYWPFMQGVLFQTYSTAYCSADAEIEYWWVTQQIRLLLIVTGW